MVGPLAQIISCNDTFNILVKKVKHKCSLPFVNENLKCVNKEKRACKSNNCREKVPLMAIL